MVVLYKYYYWYHHWVSSQFLPGRKGFFTVKTHFFPCEGKKYLSSGKKPNPGTMNTHLWYVRIKMSIYYSLVSSQISTKVITSNQSTQKYFFSEAQQKQGHKSEITIARIHRLTTQYFNTKHGYLTQLTVFPQQETIKWNKNNPR